MKYINSMEKINSMANDMTLRCFPKECPHPTKTINAGKESIARKQSLFNDACQIVKPHTILEIGSWMGASAIAWKDASKKHKPDCKVYCIDTWLGSPEHYLSSAGNEWDIGKLSITEKGPQFFEDFLVNIHEAGYQKDILPMRADSHSALTYLQKLGAKFDIIYIDGAHDEIAVFRDTSLAHQLLKDGGLICGDDFGWESVRTGLLLAAYDRATTKLSVFRKGGDFIIIPNSDKRLANAIMQLGYLKWQPLSQLHKLIRFAGKKLLYAIGKV